MIESDEYEEKIQLVRDRLAVAGLFGTLGVAEADVTDAIVGCATLDWLVDLATVSPAPKDWFDFLRDSLDGAIMRWQGEQAAEALIYRAQDFDDKKRG